MTRSAAQTALVAVSACATVLWAPASSSAQVWLPPQGEVTLVLGVQYIGADRHLGSEGKPETPGQMDFSILSSDLTYGVTDRLALRFGIPYVFGKYEGNTPHLRNGAPIAVDDGSWHGAFQDYRFEARFMAKTEGLVVTPFVAAGFPSQSYEHTGHAEPGKGIWEAGAGVNVGRLLDPVLPDAYFQAGYSYTLAERLLDVSHNRSNANLHFGYFLTPALSVRVAGFWQQTHGGFNNPADARKSAANFEHHDQLGREDFWKVGFGFGYALTGSVEVFAAWTHTLAGQNTVTAEAIGAGIAFSFSPAQIIRKRRGLPAEGAGQP